MRGSHETVVHHDTRVTEGLHPGGGNRGPYVSINSVLTRSSHMYISQLLTAISRLYRRMFLAIKDPLTQYFRDLQLLCSFAPLHYHYTQLMCMFRIFWDLEGCLVGLLDLNNGCLRQAESSQFTFFGHLER